MAGGVPVRGSTLAAASVPSRALQVFSFYFWKEFHFSLQTRRRKKVSKLAVVFNEISERRRYKRRKVDAATFHSWCLKRIKVSTYLPALRGGKVKEKSTFYLTNYHIS